MMRRTVSSYRLVVAVLVILVCESIAFSSFRLERQRQRGAKNPSEIRKQARQQRRKLELTPKLELQQQQQQLDLDQLFLRPEAVEQRRRPEQPELLDPEGDWNKAKCCPKGLKAMADFVLCDDPCCPGLRERADQAPILGLMVVCELSQATAGGFETNQQTISLVNKRYDRSRKEIWPGQWHQPQSTDRD